MEIKLTLKLTSSKYATDSREEFWAEFCRQADLPIESDDFSADRGERIYSPARMETLLWQKFMPRLNDAISYRYGNRGDGPGRVMVVGGASPPLANIALTLQRVEYNSLDLIMKVFGLEDASLMPLLAAALELYSVDSLESSMPGGNVSLRARTEYDKVASESSAPWGYPRPMGRNKENAVSPSGGVVDASKKLWAIINGSLILPLILALAITYVAFEGVLQEKDDQLKEEAILSQERTAVLNGISQQNTALSRALAETMHASPRSGTTQ
jgi:hypothetical protein